MDKEVGNSLKDTYDKQYDSSINEWRSIGGKAKAQNIIEISKNLSFNKVIDIGSGDGSVLFWLDKLNFNKQIHSLEISESGIRKIKEKAIPSVKEIKLFDGYKIPYSDDEFEVAMCSHVIEHVEHPRLLIREIKRVSKNQIFEVPIDFSFSVDQKTEHFLSYGHINIYTPQTFRFLLKSEGLKIENYINTLYPKEVFDFMNRKKGKIKSLRSSLINFVRGNMPFLMKIKPNATTVLTSKTGEELKIM